MTVTPCPRCDELVRLPEKLCRTWNASSERNPGTDVQVQCPWCLVAMPAAELTAKLPPMVLLIESATEEESLPFLTPERNADPAPFTLPKSSTSPHRTDDLEYETVDEFETVDVPEIRPDLAISAPSRRTPQKSGGLKTLLGVVFGGLMSVPIGGGILLGISLLTGRTFDFGFYPFDGSIGKASAFTAARTAAVPLDAGKKPMPRSLADELGNEPQMDPAKDAFNAIAEAQEPLERATDKVIENTNDEIVVAESDLISRDRPKVEMPPEVEPGEPDYSAVGIEPRVIRNTIESDPALIPLDPVPQKLTAAAKALDQLLEIPAEDPDRVKGVRYAYAMLSDLAGSDGNLDGEDVTGILQRIRDNQTLLVELAKLAPQWLDYNETNGDGDGALVIGKVDQAGSKLTMTLVGGKRLPAAFSSSEEPPTGVLIGLAEIDSTLDPPTILIKRFVRK